MNEHSPSDMTPPAATTSAGSASLLTQAREAAGLPIESLAAALKVSVSKLQALEAGRFDALPDLVFTRALAASACRHLKIDPAPVLQQIPMGHTPALGVPESALNAPFRSPASTPVAQLAAVRPPPAVWLAAVLLLAALLVLLWPEQPAQKPPAAAPVSAHPTVPQPAPTPTPLPAQPSPASTVPAPEASTASPAVAPPVSTTAAAAPAPVPAAVPPTQAVPAAVGTAAVAEGPNKNKVLALRAVGETWVQVVDGAGSVVVERVFKPGDVADFAATPPYKVVLGRADSMEVWVRGQPFDTQAYARNSVARFEVK